MNVQMFSSRLLSIGQRFSGLLLSRSYAKPGITIYKMIKIIDRVSPMQNTNDSIKN